mmetsp:Transcript_35995/g.64823  ORF Transcript_35995/g.64823 Transcript_35995/m.64823 type:complete len:110 (+) Transcript_35995:398-727(+)
MKTTIINTTTKFTLALKKNKKKLQRHHGKGRQTINIKQSKNSHPITITTLRPRAFANIHSIYWDGVSKVYHRSSGRAIAKTLCGSNEQYITLCLMGHCRQSDAALKFEI